LIRAALIALLAATGLPAADWLDLVAPVMSAAERKAYLALAPEARAKFEQTFWDDKSLASAEYFKRVDYVDANFGSGKPGSGANTDQGRVYLSLGAPNGIAAVASSKYFVPLEIWTYTDVQRLGIGPELRLIFFQKNSRGLYKVYSPALDTIRALLVPQAGLLGMFGPNDEITEADIRTRLNSAPVEEEIISAAVSVAPGIKGMGNQEVIGRVLSPQTIVRRDLKPLIQSRFTVWRPKLHVLFSRSPFGGVQLDLAFEAHAERDVGLQVMEGPSIVCANMVALKSGRPVPVQYLHRMDLLPGEYRAVIGIDGRQYPLPLAVPALAGTSEIVRASEARAVESRATPWELDSRRWQPASEGDFAVIAVAKPGEVTWTIRRGYEVVWRAKTAARASAALRLPLESLAPGRYRLEADAGGETRDMDFEVRPREAGQTPATVISYNANLWPAARQAFLGHQWLLRGDTARAVPSLMAGLPLKEARIDLARVDALAGRCDEARARIRPLLSADPADFEALSVMAYIEAKLQDYEAAAGYYRRALAIRESPALRGALDNLPR
jgi:GWxTD domain-containing protein